MAVFSNSPRNTLHSSGESEESSMGSSEDGPREVQFLKDVNAEIRRGFVRKVYGILSVQLLVTALVAAPFQALSLEQVRGNAWILWVSVIVLHCTMCAMCCCSEMLRTFPTNYIFLFVLTLAMSVLVGYTSALYTWQSVMLAVGVTAGIFLCMTVYAATTKTDFTGCGPYLFGALFCLTMLGFALSIMAAFGTEIHWLTVLYDLIAVLLFTFYIVFDTQLIIGGNHKNQFSTDDYVLAALNLYLDIINLFVHLLSLFGDRR